MAKITSSHNITPSTVRPVLTGPQSEAMQRIVRAQRRTINTAKIKAPVDTGIMRNAHRAEPIRIEGTMIRSAITVQTDYAAAVHDGSKPHLIKPRTKRALSWKGAGGRAFATVVHHPGARPRPWLLNAAQAEATAQGFTVTPGS